MKNKIYAIGNTHFDPVWEWTLDEGIASVRSTFRSALDRMKEYPDFKYSFSCPPVFEWIRKEDPGLFAEIQDAVRSGQWDMGEGWWLQPDCNALSGESMARQALYGQRYLQENFGVRSECVFNSDSFGHSAMMPQILKKSKIRYYCFSRPSEGEQPLDSPLFTWKSRDGSEVTAFRIFQGWATDTAGCLDNMLKHLENTEYDLMLVYGVTNHGGAPTKKAIDTLHAEKRCTVTLAGIGEYFRAQQDKKIPVVETELQPRYFGVFINNPTVKQMNRRTETMLLNAEKASVFAGRLGKDYDGEKIRDGFRDLLFNQFHDILGGACIKDAYFDARNLHGRAYYNAYEVMHQSLQYISKSVETKSGLWNLVVFNLNSTVYTGELEAEVQWVWEFPFYDGGIELVDENGRVIETQIIKEKSTIHGFRSRFVFTDSLPPFAYKTYGIRKCEKTNRLDNDAPDGISNENYRVGVENGRVTVRDIRSGETLPDLFAPYVLDDPGDTWCFNLDHYDSEPEPFRLVSAKVTENGTVKSTLKVSLKYHDSLLEQYYTIYSYSHYIDCRYRVDWREPHKVLKMKVAGGSSRFTVGIPYGSIQREASERDLPMLDYISTDRFAVLTDGVFSYNTRGTDLGLSILRSPIYGDLRISALDDPDYEYISDDICTGQLRYIPSPAGIEQAVQSFLNKPVVIDEARHTGTLPGDFRFLRCDSTAVTLEVIKQQEDGEGIILRLCEHEGRPQTATVGGWLFGEYPIPMGPYEIKTMLVRPDSVREVSILEEPMDDEPGPDAAV